MKSRLIVAAVIKKAVKFFWEKSEETYYTFLQFTCDFSSGNLKAGDDMQTFDWVDIKNLSNYNLNKPTKILFKKLGYLK